MPHINVDESLPGIRSLMAFSPGTAEPMSKLANLLLRNHEGLIMADSELIATYVSYLNDCFYCHHSHGEIACIYLGGDRELVEQVRKDYTTAAISEKLKSLLAIAAKVQRGGKFVTEADVVNAKANGADDKDIHDTVLIAATFSMFNRYVDGLDSFTPSNASAYEAMGERMAEVGYVPPVPATDLQNTTATMRNGYQNA